MLLLFLSILAGSACAAPLIQRLMPRRAGWCCAMPPLALCVWLATQVQTVATGSLLQERYSWIPSLGISVTLRMDGLGLLFSLLISGIGLLVMLYAAAYLRGHRHLGRFYAMLLLFMAAMLGTVLAGDLITLFLFWELTGISSFLLIGFDHEREESRRAALQALLVTGAGGLALLAGILLLGQAAESTELAMILERGGQVRADARYTAMLLLVLAGAFTKSAQFPFHFWLPGAMAAPTPVSAYLHSATMVKLGIYLLARLSPVLGGSDLWFFGLTLTGGLTLLVGGWHALRCTDLKQVLAWTTVSALGMLTLLLGLGTPLAITAAMLFLTVHALYKSALFLAVGAVDHAAGSREITRLGGLARFLPQVAVAAGLAALSMAGLPPLAGFIVKELLYEAALTVPLLPVLVTVVAVLGSALAVAAALLAGYVPFYGALRDSELHPHRVETVLWFAPLVPALLGLVIGLVPDPLGRLLIAPAASVVNGALVPVSLALWHGPGPVLLLSLGTFAAGGLLAALTASLRRPAAVDGQYLPTGERIYRLLLDGLQQGAVAVTARLQSGRLRYYLMSVTGAAVILMGGVMLGGRESGLDIPMPDGHLHEWLTALVILAGALMATVTRSRLAAVAALGTVGYGVALIYILFGAPDLAMTQFCIETLSIILFVLVLHRLPHFTQLSSPLTRSRDVVVSLAIGGIMTMLVWLAISQPMVSHLSDWFLEQSLPAGHGRNVVNVILVDFRALDTLGEITVLAVAALGVYGLLRPRSGEGGRE
ncbi:putative monovalent cation/H+ antiporter subunit A [Trichlorobacter ammonificans]|uniref:Cation:proton antiporter n=1 Tax=Trichlorobacter ammonificans TaxID=2916410 RepID=A0ABM9D6S7_9BACT|nr:putative monovalent cation/H+ antiporter subunit A [Trichlorobacter ammonificans]CAH2030899.1 Cation:proton antiporter [Trichlorobacter ammonificans]